MWHLVVKIASSEYNKYVEITTFNEVEYIGLANDLLLNARAQMVVYQCRRNTLNGKFTGGIYLCQYDFIEQTQCISEIFVEIAGTGVQMGLEDGCYLDRKSVV